MRQVFIIAASVLFLLSVLPGCIPFEFDQNGTGSGNWEVSESSLEGTIGAIENFAGLADALDVSDSMGGLRVDSVVDAIGGAAMTIVEIQENGLDQLEPGTYVFDSRGQSATTDVTMRVTACSGDTRGDWDYDAPADETVVEVEEDRDVPGGLALTYHSRIPRDGFAYTGDQNTADFREIDGRIVLVRTNNDDSVSDNTTNVNNTNTNTNTDTTNDDDFIRPIQW